MGSGRQEVRHPPFLDRDRSNIKQGRCLDGVGSTANENAPADMAVTVHGGDPQPVAQVEGRLTSMGVVLVAYTPCARIAAPGQRDGDVPMIGSTAVVGVVHWMNSG